MKTISILAGAFAVALMSTSAFADNWALNVDLGPSFGNNGIGTQFLIGGDLMYKVDPAFEVGLYGAYNQLASATAVVSGVTANGTAGLTTLEAEGDYLFSGPLAGLFAGIRLGLGIESTSYSLASGGSSVNIPGSSNTVFVFGVQAGYDYMLGSGFSIGAEAALEVYSAFVSGGSSFVPFNLLGRVGYHF